MRRRKPSWNPYRDEYHTSSLRRQFAAGGAAAGGAGASSAAVSALALLSFAFFLNIIQQQIQNGPPLFNRMVNGTVSGNGTNSGNGTGTGATGGGGAGNFTQLHNKRRRPALIALAVNTKKGVKRRPPKRKNNKFKKGKWQKKKRRPRDIQDDAERGLSDWDDHQEDEENSSPIMMPGLPHAGSMQLSAWMQGAMQDSDLKYDLVDTLTNCRAVIACTSYRAAKGTDRESLSYISDTTLKKILDEAGEYTELGEINEACEDLLQASAEECTLLAQSLGKLTPDLGKVQFTT